MKVRLFSVSEGKSPQKSFMRLVSFRISLHDWHKNIKVLTGNETRVSSIDVIHINASFVQPHHGGRTEAPEA